VDPTLEMSAPARLAIAPRGSQAVRHRRSAAIARQPWNVAPATTSRMPKSSPSLRGGGSMTMVSSADDHAPSRPADGRRGSPAYRPVARHCPLHPSDEGHQHPAPGSHGRNDKGAGRRTGEGDQPAGSGTRLAHPCLSLGRRLRVSSGRHGVGCDRDREESTIDRRGPGRVINVGRPRAALSAAGRVPARPGLALLSAVTPDPASPSTG
jgi:hypothetical protein